MRVLECELYPDGRSIATDPHPGDAAVRIDRPTRRVEIVFTDATGEQWLHYTETRCVSVKTWARFVRRSGARAGGHRD